MNATTGRNLIYVFLAAATGYIALAVFGTVDLVFGLSVTSAQSLGGYILLRLTAIWTYVAAGAVIGAVVGLTVEPRHRRAWPLVAGVLGAALIASGMHWVAPDWQERVWMATELLLVAGAAAGAAVLVGRRRQRNTHAAAAA